MSTLKLLAVLISVFAVTAVVWASEADELRAKSEALQREAAELAELGRRDEAERLMLRARDLMAEAERVREEHPEAHHPEIMELRERLGVLQKEQRELQHVEGAEREREELQHETDVTRRRMAELHEHLKHDREEAEHHEHVPQRLEHMHQAIHHLHEAGLHDVAEHVAQQAEQLEREFHEAHQHEHHDHDDPMHHILQQLEEMRHQMERLRDEVNELKHRRR